MRHVVRVSLAARVGIAVELTNARRKCVRTMRNRGRPATIAVAPARRIDGWVARRQYARRRPAYLLLPISRE
ncbi:hypothetical protein BVI434_940003 [Burkholderia vietnamiensis]|nr:hypothetical protein BVI434_940003 [Burkholderia vietnamiensis]